MGVILFMALAKYITETRRDCLMNLAIMEMLVHGRGMGSLPISVCHTLSNYSCIMDRTPIWITSGSMFLVPFLMFQCGQQIWPMVVPGYTGWRLFGKPWKYVNDQNRDPMADELGAQWSTEIINRDHSKPFALFTGLIRTHTPLYAPKNYFDRFPLDSIKLPDADTDDLDDVAEALGNKALYGFRRYKMLVRHEGKDLLRHWLQAYMACVSFVDDQVGTILDAVDASPARDNTIGHFH